MAEIAHPAKRKPKLAPEAQSLMMISIDMEDGCMRPWCDSG